jgi:sugar (pentulose or hexulose) kinase
MMNKEQTLGQIAAIEAQIKELTAQRDALRNEAVINGYAVWTYTVRQSAPSLAWWKENRPTVWQKYATETKVKRFTVA